MTKLKEMLKYIDINPEKASKLAQRLHIKKDEIPFIRKYYIAEKSDVNEDERSLTALVSTGDKDRDGEIVTPKGIDLSAYLKNSVLMWAHRYSDPPIGRALWSKVDEQKGLICKFQFAKTQFADEIYRLYKDGFLRAFSIGFIPLDYDEETKIHKKISLLEVSAVPVPANENALVTEAYQKGFITSKRLVEDLAIEVEDFQEEVEIENEVQAMTPDELKEHYRGLQEVEVEKLTQEDIDWMNAPMGPIEEDKEIEIDAENDIVTKEDEPDLQDTVNELIENGVEDVEDLAFDDVEEKRFDLEGNPSVWDIMDAISSTIRTPMNSKTWRYVTDLYPVKYPDGHVIIEESSEKTERKYFLHPYEYDEGKIKLGESKELEATYKPKEREFTGLSEVREVTGLSEIKEMLADFSAELKEGRVLSRKNREVVKNAVTALMDVLKADSTGSREDEDKEEVEDEKEVEVVVEKSEYSAEEIQVMMDGALEKAVSKMDLGKAVDRAVKKLKGKVE